MEFKIQSLPLLQYVEFLHKKISLERVLLIGAQHLLETTCSLLQVCFNKGLSPRNVFLIGKCYSSNQSVIQEMEQAGVSISSSSSLFDPRLSFDQQYYEYVEAFSEDVLSSIEVDYFEKVIVLDDGGQLITLLHNQLKKFDKIIGIEQTSSGYEKLKNINLHFPVINVARSPAKLVYESPLIAEVVIKKLYERIPHLLNVPRKILIIGRGVIGTALYSALCKYHSVKIYDEHEIQNSHSREDLDDQLPEADIILGCTGFPSIIRAKHSLLKKGCVLVSTSSSDREFDSVYLREQSNVIKSCHDDVDANGIHLLNCGFPINFDGGRNSVPPEKIQFTRALLAAGIFQAQNVKYNISKIIPLDINIQRSIISKYFEESSKSLLDQ